MRLRPAHLAVLLTAACGPPDATSGGSTAAGSSSSTTATGSGGSSTTVTSASSATTGAGMSGSGMAGGNGIDAGSTGGAGGAGSGGSSSSDGGTGTVAARVRWVGRVDLTDQTKPRFGWSGTGFVARFSGTSISVNLTNADAFFFQPVIDGQKGVRFPVASGTATHQVASGLSAGVHTLELYREIEAVYGVSQFVGVTEGTLMDPPPPAGRLIEFVGDSITAGYGDLGVEPHPNGTTPMPCHYTYATQSAYVSYAALTARALDAEASLIALSGWGVYRSFTGEMTQILPRVYANTLGPTAPPTWDFAVKADVVVVNLGTNDFNLGDPGPMFTTALSALADTIRSKYPNAWIFLALGSMLPTAKHDQARVYLQSIVASHNGDAGKLAFVDMGVQDVLQGTGCDFHPNVAEHQAMADVLVPAVKQKLGW